MIGTRALRGRRMIRGSIGMLMEMGSPAVNCGARGGAFEFRMT